MLVAAGSAAVTAFNIDAAVVRLLALAANKRAARSEPAGDGGGFQATPFTLCKISDFTEPTEQWRTADGVLKAFAGELAGVGGLDLMVDVFDAAVEAKGYRAVQGVSASWDGCHGWWH